MRGQTKRGVGFTKTRASQRKCGTHFERSLIFFAYDFFSFNVFLLYLFILIIFCLLRFSSFTESEEKPRAKTSENGSLRGCDSSISSPEIADKSVELPVCESVPDVGSEIMLKCSYSGPAQDEKAIKLKREIFMI